MTGLRIDEPELAEEPPATKLVYLVLKEAGPCTQAELRARTHLSDRTARRALDRLQEVGLVAEIPLVDDRRHPEFELSAKLSD